MNKFTYNVTTWWSAATKILDIRRKIFIIEQQFKKTSLCDQYESDSYHALVYDHQGNNIACGRLTSDGLIGRVAVLVNYKRQGIGSNILSSD